MFESTTMTFVTYGAIGIATAVFIDFLVRELRAALPAPCRLIRAIFAPDRCAGACPPGTACVAVRTRRYLLVLRQAADCACVLVPAGGGGGAGGGAGGGGGAPEDK